MANSNYIKGRGYWMKVLGEPVDNYGKDGKEWTGDVTVDDEARAVLEAAGVADKIKNKDERGDFLAFKQKATRRNGESNRPITIVDARNRPWPQDVKIGNESLIELKFNVVPYPGKPSGLYPQAIRVLEHVPYERQEFAALPEDSEYVKNAPAAKPATPEGHIAGLDDDVDF